MQTFLFILIILAALGAVVSIIRGVQNRMMWRRIQFQAIAVILAALFLMIARGHAG
jgi:asparagine N-glycosylation enzyme membrane subunit Stt3